jgi:hypothetical protein
MSTSAVKSPLQSSRISEVGESSNLEAIVAGLVREHLHRRNLHSVLKLYDEETGYKGSNVDASNHHGHGPSSTASLLKKFKLTSLFNRNQASQKPLRSVLELLCAFFLHRLDPHTYSVEETDVISDSIDAVEAQQHEDSSASSTTRFKTETAAPATLFTEVMAVIPPPAPPTVPENDSLSTSSDISSGDIVSAAPPVIVSSSSEPLAAVVNTSLPSVPVPKTSIPVSAPAPAPMSFFERLAAQKAAEAAMITNSVPLVSTVERSSSDSSTSSTTSIPIVTTTVNVPNDPPVTTVPNDPPVTTSAELIAPPLAPAPAAPMTFFERLAAQKAAAASAAASSVSSSATVEKVDTQATAPTPIPDARAGMSFAERLAAQKSASAPAPSQTPDSVITPALTPAAPPVATSSVASVNVPSASFAFTAPDGKGFATRDEYRKYMFATYYSYSSRTGETLLKAPGTLDGQPFSMDDMKDCTIMLCDHSETVQVDRVTNCKILIAACCESVFLRNCTDCTIYVACKQLRTRDCVNCRVFLYSKTDPIIEASHTMLLAPFMASYPGLSKHMKSARLEPQYNHWKRIFDFSADDTKLPRPHWSIMDESEWGDEWIIEGIPGTPENPVPRDAAPKDEGALPEGFDIKKGPAAAEAALQKTAPVVINKPLTGVPTSIPPSVPPAPGGGNSFFARLAAKNREQ